MYYYLIFKNIFKTHTSLLHCPSPQNSKFQIGDKPENYKVYTVFTQCIPGSLPKKPVIIKLLVFPQGVVT